MDKEDNLVSEVDSEQARAIDQVIGRKIWNIEILEDGDQAMIKIELSEDDGDFILIHGEGIDMYITTPKQRVLN